MVSLAEAETPLVERVPKSPEERNRLRNAAYAHVKATGLEPPFTSQMLLDESQIILRNEGLPCDYSKFVAILISNAAWEDTVARIPFNRRVLFLPQCIRPKDICKGQIDGVGLTCEFCGACDIASLQQKAEELGYAVLVAEGTSVITKMLLRGQIDAVIGVSCISVLEKAFPYMAAGAIPGLAFPLLHDGCEKTDLEYSWISEALDLSSSKSPKGGDVVNLDELSSTVDDWFDEVPLNSLLDLNKTQTEKIGIEWLARGGKRWRPLLAASAFETLTGIHPKDSDCIRHIAIAVECFHKASLIHDDIEDDDELRYEQPTLHMQHGVPIAINAGDYLLGEGYRLIAECGAEPQAISRMLSIAARGHRDLSLGQGEELWWTHDPGPLTVDSVIEIFRRKTAPAFEVALSLGALAGGADNQICVILNRFSEKLGIAYQIQDDLDDYQGLDQRSDIDAMRASLLVALCYENADDELRKRMEEAWRRHKSFNGLSKDLCEHIEAMGIPEKAREMLVDYRNQALADLLSLKQMRMRQLLSRLTGKIVDVG